MKNKRRRPSPSASRIFQLLGTVVLLLIHVCASGVVFPNEEGKDNLYSQEFFESHLENAALYPILVRHILDVLTMISQSLQQPTSSATTVAGVPVSSVVDVGCGHGLLVEAFRNAGIYQSYGLEGSPHAQSMWPVEYADRFYQLVDLTQHQEVAARIPATQLVVSTEVGEHLPAEMAHDYVRLLTHHRPLLVVFGAATPFQDQGQNPSHVNENTFAYWRDLFARQNYSVDWAATARLKHNFVTDPAFARYIPQAWWYPKNILIFVNVNANNGRNQEDLDQRLVTHPQQADMRAEAYLGLADVNELGPLWRRDWLNFADLFYQAQTEAYERLARHVEF